MASKNYRLVHFQDKNAAFEDTKRFALQSLASVAYQINTLARDLLDMLELQTDKVDNMANQVDTLNTVSESERGREI